MCVCDCVGGGGLCSCRTAHVSLYYLINFFSLFVLVLIDPFVVCLICSDVATRVALLLCLAVCVQLNERATVQCASFPACVLV